MPSPSFFLSLLSLAGAGSDAVAPEVVERRILLMGTYANVTIAAASRERAVACTEIAFAELRAADDDLSTWRPQTPISRLNRASIGEFFDVPTAVWESLAPALELSEETGGAFNPAIGALTEAWQIHGEGRIPTEEERNHARAAVGHGGFLIDREQRRLCRLHPQAVIDTGGFGKGAALDRAAAALRENGCEQALLDLGGQLLAVGGPFMVDVADPVQRDIHVGTVALRDASISTSGNGERSLRVGAISVGHLLNPAAAAPARGAGSVTVLAPTGLEADALSTALFVMGADAGLAWIRARADVSVWYVSSGSGEEPQVRSTGRGRLLPGRHGRAPRERPMKGGRGQGAGSGHRGSVPRQRGAGAGARAAHPKRGPRARLSSSGDGRAARSLSPTEAALEEARKQAGVAIEHEVWTAYVGSAGGRVIGTAWFDTHIVRTLPETLMVVVAPDGSVARVDVLTFSEPPDYLPRKAWYEQFRTRRLDPDLRSGGTIRGITGATLSARQATDAVRRVLAVAAVTHGQAASREAPMPAPAPPSPPRSQP